MLMTALRSWWQFQLFKFFKPTVSVILERPSQMFRDGSSEKDDIWIWASGASRWHPQDFHSVTNIQKRPSTVSHQHKDVTNITILNSKLIRTKSQSIFYTIIESFSVLEFVYSTNIRNDNLSILNGPFSFPLSYSLPPRAYRRKIKMVILMCVQSIQSAIGNTLMDN